MKRAYLTLRCKLAFTLGLLGIQSATNSTAEDLNQPLTHREVWKKTAGAFSGDIFLLPKRGNFFLDEDQFDQKFLRWSTIKGKRIAPHPEITHGFAWDYDLQIPLTFYDPSGRWFKRGSYALRATQQDIAPTFSSILGIPAPARVSGRVLSEALIPQKTASERPRAIVVFVQDQVGLQFYAAHPGVAKFYESLMTQGANFKNAAVSHVDVETSVGHAAVGTGAWPGEHGVNGNDYFHSGLLKTLRSFTVPVSSAKKENLVGNSSLFLTPTFADLWISATKGQAKVLSQAFTPRASIGLAGHGALFSHGKKTNVVWMDEKNDTSYLYETDEKIYELPASYKTLSVKPYVDQLTKGKAGMWMGHSLYFDDGRVHAGAVKASPAQSTWEGELAVQAIRELKIGIDDITDLVFVNLKATDTCGHVYGYESDECGDVLKASDEAAKRIVQEISSQSKGSYIAVLTADHGAAALPELSGGLRYSREALHKDLNQKFDRLANNIDAIQKITSSQIYLNINELRAGGSQLSDVVNYLKSYEVPLAPPYNAHAAEFIKQGKAMQQRFFEDVAAKDEL